MTECFVFDYPSENFEVQADNKNLTYNVKMKDKFLISKMRKKTIITILIITIFGLMGTGAFLTYLYSHYDHSEYCLTDLCYRSAENLLSSMNSSIDPCDNFYQFACGNWAHNHPIPKYRLSADWFDSLQDDLLRKISDFLRKNDSDDESIPVHQARILYRSCITMNETENEDLSPIQEILLDVNLTLLPPYNVSSPNFSWVRSAVLSKGIFDQDFFIRFSISSDPKNRTHNKLYISKPLGQSPLPVHHYYKNILRHNTEDSSTEGEEEDNEFEEEPNISKDFKNNFVNFVKNVSQFMFASADVKWTEELDTAFNKSVYDLLRFQTKVDELIENYYENGSSIPNYISIADLQTLTNTISEEYNADPIIDWKEYFENMFESAENVTLDFEETDSVIIISDLDYIKEIFHKLTQTSSEVIEFYMWWTVVSTIIPYINNEKLSEYHDEFLYALIESKKAPREVYCAEVVNQLLGMATTYSIIHDTNLAEKMLKISEMVNDIQLSFLQNIETIEWMDQKTKAATIKKIKAMKKYIGFPTFLKDPEELNKFYDEVNVSETNFLNNILSQVQQQHRNMLAEYRTPNDYNQEMWVSNPMEVNAYNFMEGNTITIPAGILQFPFYGLGVEALNYGAIGSIIGHEITHSFDNSGKEYDDSGNTNPWWTEQTITEFRNRAECFVNYYGNIHFPKGTNFTINGMKTLDENIADNGGIRIALFAYRNYIRKYGAEPLLPQLKTYSAEKLFFLAFANTWCEHSSEQSIIQSLHDEHSPNNIRVLATLINSKEFAQTWKCKPGTPMNPYRSKCQMW